MIEDIMQNVVIGIINNEKTFDQLTGDDRKKYIVSCIMNRRRDIARKSAAQKRRGIKLYPVHCREEDFGYEPAIAVHPDVYAKIGLREVLQKGHKHQFFSWLKMYAEGYTNNEIAAFTKSNINTTLGRVRYARNFLKK